MFDKGLFKNCGWVPRKTGIYSISFNKMGLFSNSHLVVSVLLMVVQCQKKHLHPKQPPSSTLKSCRANVRQERMVYHVGPASLHTPFYLIIVINFGKAQLLWNSQVRSLSMRLNTETCKRVQNAQHTQTQVRKRAQKGVKGCKRVEKSASA